MFVEQIREKLQSNIDRAKVKQRKQGGRQVDYIDSFYVIDTMNQVFGNGGWSYDVDPQEVARYMAKSYNGEDQQRVTFTCRSTVRIGEWSATDYGTGHGADKDLGQAIESALKEACTDALKRACRTLGRYVGLALYDKSQEFVEAKPAEQRQAERKAETPEEAEARQAGHHPSWGSDRGKFMADIGALDFKYDELLEFLEWNANDKGISFTKPSEMTREQRAKLLGFLAGEAGGVRFGEFLSFQEAQMGPTDPLDVAP